ncbi:hypothetical protein [Kibdelosporangium phytohabitans]|uniref:Uncharacterized protein n=1 Tax=Kibdelosporangium phytohabitans TaxID=860235 RepID=A0A0N9I1X5_9PSEU|nr:hypothetical protein [Kibdelosporangium phytohabitans]ALG08185.1 hypothetical protein AOZ06_15835 [Kibdelosporangium phytohabitans]MBE1470821.1 hypothetical protein [Kibdelosporangium phytohabitans]
MSIEELNRTNIQALYRYMPGQPFNWSSKVSVVGRSPRHTSPLDIPEAWVAPQLRRLIRPFAEGVSRQAGVGPELEVIDRGQYALVKAEDLQASRFPNTFHCAACGHFRTVRVGERIPNCPHDHGQMRQFPWAEIHECGHLKQITAPRCANNCRASMALFNTESFSISRWYWQCERCRTRSTQPVVNWCTTCRTGRANATRIPQSSAYYPQQITVLNPPTRDAYASLAHDRVHLAAVAQSLGVLPPGADGLRMAGGTRDSEGAVAQFQKMAAVLGWQPGDEMYERGLADARAKEGTAPAWAEQVDALGLDPESVDALGDECLQLSLARSAAALTIDDLRTESADELHPTYAAYPALFERYGLRDVTLLRQLPIAYIDAGYTRVSPKAHSSGPRGDVNTRFRFFEAGRDRRFPMYGVRTETEGLLFSLDQLRVVEWLAESGVVDDPGVTTVEDAQRWLFTVTEPVTDIFNAPESRITKAILGLVHSMAHRTMKALATRCGLNVDSLAEYLFPANSAFLIYANTRSEFILGGLEHVYRYDLADALSELDAESRCVFDPPCRHSFGGACAACLYVSEVACARFNTVLDRNLLFGSLPATVEPAGQTNQEVTWRPYWNH